MIRHFARAVLARAPSEKSQVLRWAGCGLNGLSVDCSHIGTSDRAAFSRFSTFARRAGALAPACVAYGLQSRGLILAAWAAGFTHVAGPAIATEAGALGGVRLRPVDLWGRQAA